MAKFKLKGKKLVYFLSHVDSWCRHCNGQVEEGEECAFIPSGVKVGGKLLRYLCVECAAKLGVKEIKAS